MWTRPHRKFKSPVIHNTYHPVWDKDGSSKPFIFLVHDPDIQELHIQVTSSILPPLYNLLAPCWRTRPTLCWGGRAVRHMLLLRCWMTAPHTAADEHTRNCCASSICRKTPTGFSPKAARPVEQLHRRPALVDDYSLPA